MTELKKAVAYHRVSPTLHKKGDSGIHSSLEESIRICHLDAKHDGYEIVHDYIDEYISGKSTKYMIDFNKLIADSKNKPEWDKIYCRRVNRFGRNRSDMVRSEIELTDLGFTLKFVENGIDTGKPFGKSIMALLAEMAEQDRVEILENIKRGRDKALAEGKHFGKPRKEINVVSIRRLRMTPIPEGRPSWDSLEKDYGVSRTTMIRRLKESGYWDFDNNTVK